VLAVYAIYHATEPELVEPEFYGLCPEPEERLDLPHALRLFPALGRLPGLTAFKAVYRTGHGCREARPIWPRPVWNWLHRIWYPSNWYDCFCRKSPIFHERDNESHDGKLWPQWYPEYYPWFSQAVWL
jgi:hypothetical protein